MLHALGLFHEHQRPDRDQYIEINMTTVYAKLPPSISNQLKKACFLK